MGLAFVLTYIALNLLSPADMIPALAPFRPMLILAALNVPLAVLTRLQAPEVGKLRVQVVLVTLFFAFACVALFPHRQLGANLTTFTDLLPNLLAYYLGIIHFRSPQRLRIVRAVLVFIALFILLNALLELPFARSTGVSTPYVMVQGYTLDTIVPRIRGLGMLNDPNTYGQLLVTILPMLFVAANDRGLGIGWLAALPVSLLFLAGIFLTGSRGTVLGLAVVMGLFFISRLPKIAAILTTGVGALLLLSVNAYGTRTVSLSGGMDRLAIWSDGMSYFKSSPIWGIGPRNFGERYGMTAHNSYLLVAAELGIIGYYLWMAASVVTIIQLGRIIKLDKVEGAVRRWATALRISLGGYLFTSFFLSRAYELPLYMLLGMCGGLIISAGGDEAVPARGSGWPVITLVICVALLSVIYLMLRLRVV